jgi:hypothetical protein
MDVPSSNLGGFFKFGSSPHDPMGGFDGIAALGSGSGYNRNRRGGGRGRSCLWFLSLSLATLHFIPSAFLVLAIRRFLCREEGFVGTEKESGVGEDGWSNAARAMKRTHINLAVVDSPQATALPME